MPPSTLLAPLALGLLLTLPHQGSGAAPERDELVAHGDEAWHRRAAGARGFAAAPQPIGEAVEAFERALELDPGDLEARWKLMRALYFQGEYVADSRETKLAVFERGRALGEEGLDRLAEPLGGRQAIDDLEPEDLARRLQHEPTATPIYFWSSVHWGLWGRTRGKMAAARQGVAHKVRDRARVTIALDERYEQAGGHRILGRLHTEAPRIPFVTGWVDRETAVEELERAVELAPQDKLNQLYLAEALWEFRRPRRPEALAILRQLAREEPSSALQVEESKTLDDARILLERVE